MLGLMGSNGHFLVSKRGNFGNPGRLGRSDDLSLMILHMALQYEGETCDLSADGVCGSWMVDIAIQNEVDDWQFDMHLIESKT